MSYKTQKDINYKKISMILMGIAVIFYMGKQPFMGSRIEFWVTPMIWLGLVIIYFIKIPKVHDKGKLKLHGKIYLWAFNVAARAELYAACFLKLARAPPLDLCERQDGREWWSREERKEEEGKNPGELGASTGTACVDIYLLTRT